MLETLLPKDGYRCSPFVSQPHSPHLIQTLSSPFPYKTLPNLSNLCTLYSINKEMAAAIPTATLSAAALCSCSLSSNGRKPSMVFIQGLNSFGGLKAHTGVATLGLPKCADQSFSAVMSSLKSASLGKKRGGGALSSTCNAVAEIFKIAAIMNGLVLVGVAVGFVLLRIEATLEEE
ncbi:uncharacterized protein M6B38_416005 [Iris pallida]|uniref:PetM of cytochrome b6/f complex subunit 7 n=1 Tax=Iris pallida TaxID=29817 RepID=A0AAX6FKH2_IRIPA|nr:uncharacterized protein M6B38_416005 [Iris pallida]